ncbi:MAG: hypothetical protein Q7S16_05785 [bacterium]|nr:hypothetical protein [bacterium]
MTITLLLIPYTLFLIIDVLLSSFAIYNLLKFSIQTRTTFLAIFFYIAASIIVLLLSFTTIAEIDWTTPLFQGFSLDILK